MYCIFIRAYGITIKVTDCSVYRTADRHIENLCKMRGGVVSRKVINILFITGSCLYIPGIAMIIWAYVALFHNMVQSSYSSTYASDPFNGLAAFMGFLWGGVAIMGIGSVILLVSRIGALIELGKAQEWVWFTLMIIFGWIVLLLYLTIGPKSEPVPKYVGHPYPYPPGQPWPGYYPPQAPGMMPPGQPWPGYYPPPQAPGMTPMQPWPTPPMERQNMPERPQE
jgi:hypothetical protein